ncbi:MAG TPA: FAD-dependent oxidoreductase [Bacillota bacterium]|nr:FAD-dependent oxidoreductase [Bacillota bacterium]
MYDIAIVGGGPAGLAAAINSRRRNKKTLVIGKEEYSFKLLQTHQIDNYPGLPEIGGKDLAQKLKEHALAGGAEFCKDEVQTISSDETVFTLVGRENMFQAKTLILAVGVALGNEIKGETEWIGKGVSYCATCDGMFFKGKKVALVGYIPEAVAEANFLAEVCAEVYFLPLFKNVENLNPRIKAISGKPLEIGGDSRVELFRTSKTEVKVDGVFIERSGRPADQLLADLQIEDGLIVTGPDQTTNLPGVFAAGDCTGRPWQIARAVGQGQVAALSAVHYLENLKELSPLLR